MEVGESLFSASERHALDSFLSGIEGGDALDQPYPPLGGQAVSQSFKGRSEGAGLSSWTQGKAGPSRRSTDARTERPPEVRHPLWLDCEGATPS